MSVTFRAKGRARASRNQAIGNESNRTHTPSDRLRPTPRESNARLNSLINAAARRLGSQAQATVSSSMHLEGTEELESIHRAISQPAKRVSPIAVCTCDKNLSPLSSVWRRVEARSGGVVRSDRRLLGRFRQFDVQLKGDGALLDYAVNIGCRDG